MGSGGDTGSGDIWVSIAQLRNVILGEFPRRAGVSRQQSWSGGRESMEGTAATDTMSGVPFDISC